MHCLILGQKRAAIRWTPLSNLQRWQLDTTRFLLRILLLLWYLHVLWLGDVLIDGGPRDEFQIMLADQCFVPLDELTDLLVFVLSFHMFYLLCSFFLLSPELIKCLAFRYVDLSRPLFWLLRDSCLLFAEDSLCLIFIFFFLSARSDVHFFERQWSGKHTFFFCGVL